MHEALEQRRKELSHLLHVVVRHRITVYQDLPRLNLIKPEHQFNDSGFSRAVDADDRQLISFVESKRNAGQHILIGMRILEAYVIKGRTTCNMIDFKSSDNGLSSNNGPASTGDANTFLKASAPDVGVNCWCKMDGPVTSWWTYLKKYEDSDDKSGRKICEEQCTTLCATAFAKNTNIDGGNTGILIRNALLNKIW